MEMRGIKMDTAFLSTQLLEELLDRKPTNSEGTSLGRRRGKWFVWWVNDRGRSRYGYADDRTRTAAHCKEVSLTEFLEAVNGTN